MYCSAQKNGATARELDALRYAAQQSGEGADKAEASFNAFSQRIRDFATGASRQYKALFGVYLFERPRDKACDTYTRQGYANRILREHGGNQTPIANPFAHWDPKFRPKSKSLALLGFLWKAIIAGVFNRWCHN